MMIYGRLEYVGVSAEGEIHLHISKESKDLILAVVAMLKEFEGKDVEIRVRRLR